MRLELNLDFRERFAPDRFFFGVAYAPYCEGGLNGPDDPKNTDWARSHPGLGKRSGEGSVSGSTTSSTSSWRPRSG